MPSLSRLVAVTTSDGAGAASFAFPAVPRGTVLQGTVSCPRAPLAAHFVVVMGGLEIGSFDGYNPWGEIQALPGETLTLTATGLAAKTNYQAVWVVGAYPESAAPAAPTPYGSITNISSSSVFPVSVSIVQLPPPPVSITLSENITMTGSQVQFPTAALTIGVTMLADTANAHLINIGLTGLGAAAGYLRPGQGLTLPLQQANILYALGTAPDQLSIWGA